jgi:hypothetical protein
MRPGARGGKIGRQHGTSDSDSVQVTLSRGLVLLTESNWRKLEQVGALTEDVDVLVIPVGLSHVEMAEISVSLVRD